MAIFGVHTVVSLCLLTVMSKFGERYSLVQLWLIKGLTRYMTPSNDDLRAVMPPDKSVHPRKRQKKREEEDAEGFNVPKKSVNQLQVVAVDEPGVRLLPLYSQLSWLSLFTPFALLAFLIAESYITFFAKPGSSDFNVCLIWLLCLLAFVVRALVACAAIVIESTAERSVLLSFGALYFLVSVLFVMFAERGFDLHIHAVYHNVTSSALTYLQSEGVLDSAASVRSPLLLYLAVSAMWSVTAALLVFPNFRLARMYTRLVQDAERPFRNFLVHATFLLPALFLVLYAHPIKSYLMHHPRLGLTSEEVDSIRVLVLLVWIGLRFALFKAHMQTHLNQSRDKLEELRTESGVIRNRLLQSMIFSYYSYFNVAALQYFAPPLMCLSFGLLLKATGDVSLLPWIFAASRQAVEDTTPASALSPGSLVVLRHLFNETVSRGLWHFALFMSVLINFSLSLIGVLYNYLLSR